MSELLHQFSIVLKIEESYKKEISCTVKTWSYLICYKTNNIFEMKIQLKSN